MTEPKSPREIAEDIVYDEAYSRQELAEAVERAILSYAAERERLRDALEDIAWQFAHRTVIDGRRGLSSGGLSASEHAFSALGWDDPHFPEQTDGCQAPDCPQWAECGAVTVHGYERLCGEHYRLRSRPATEGKREDD